jgi:hypothetical protein
VVFRLNERLRERRALLLLVVPPTSQVARLLDIVALPKAVAIYDTIESALDGATAERH